MNNENIIVGAKIRKIREMQGLSRERLAENANISIQFLSDIETGKKGMTISTLKKLCFALKITPNTVICDTEENEFCTLINDLVSSLPKEKQEKMYNIIVNIAEY